MYKPTFLAILLLSLGACGQEPAPPPETLRLVKVMPVQAQTQVSSLRLAGEVQARHASPLAFQVGGKLLERRVNLGDSVTTGQVLARLDDADFILAERAAAAAKAAAQADLALAESELTRYRGLIEKQLVAATVLEQKQTLADAARARLQAVTAEHAAAVRQVEYATLSAAADGIITALAVDVGQVVAPGQAVMSIAHDGEREIEVYVPEADLQRVRTASGFSITLNAQPGLAIQGSLRELAAAADPLTRSYAARIAIDTPPDSLQLGMSATVATVHNGAQVLRLPLAAVVSRDGNPYVWKLDEASSTVHAAAVRTGALDGDGVMIETGIQPGDVVVSAGANLLREGQQVRALR